MLDSRRVPKISLNLVRLTEDLDVNRSNLRYARKSISSLEAHAGWR